VPFAALQAQGRPDLVAKFHLLELLPFIALLWWSLHRFGLLGAAGAWSLRVTADAVLLFRFSPLGISSLRVLWPGGVLVLAAWLSVHFLRVSFTLDRTAIGSLLLAVSCGWALATSPYLQSTVAHALRYVGIKRKPIHD